MTRRGSRDSGTRSWRPRARLAAARDEAARLGEVTAQVADAEARLAAAKGEAARLEAARAEVAAADKRLAEVRSQIRAGQEESATLAARLDDLREAVAAETVRRGLAIQVAAPALQHRLWRRSRWCRRGVGRR